jgi:hypothetical protein
MDWMFISGLASSSAGAIALPSWASQGELGTLTLIQRFGSVDNLNIHLKLIHFQMAYFATIGLGC